MDSFGIWTRNKGACMRQVSRIAANVLLQIMIDDLILQNKNILFRMRRSIALSLQ